MQGRLKSYFYLENRKFFLPWLKIQVNLVFPSPRFNESLKKVGKGNFHGYLSKYLIVSKLGNVNFCAKYQVEDP
jgi:hypothetical protein